MRLELVTHCWNYTRLLRYQIESLRLNAPSFDLTYSIFFCEEDLDTVALLNEIHQLPNCIHWNPMPLPKKRLMRRAIGRNIAAKETKADWIWFTDADVIFGPGALDSLPALLEKVIGPLAYPGRVIKTSFAEGDGLITRRQNVHRFPELYFTDPEELNRAIGPCQIVRGSTARKMGYCADTEFQKEEMEWQRCFEDVKFREILGTNGQAIALPNVYLIRHSVRGRNVVGAKL